MPRTVTTTVYGIGELPDAAKDAARSWYREHCLDHAWYDFVYEDFETICGLLGINLRTSPEPLYGGGTRDRTHIHFTGFWNQGDGACYEGSYSHARGAARAVRMHAPQDEQLHRIADTLQAVQRRNFYQLHSSISHRDRYYHEYCMDIRVERDSPTWQSMTDGAEDIVIEALRDLARWLYRQLQHEYEHQSSDEVVDEVIAINEWTFTKNGERFG